MKRSAATRRARNGAAHPGVRREAQRHAAFVRAGRGVCSLRCVRAKAVSPLRSATAVQDAFGPPDGGGNLPGVGKKLVAIRGRAQKSFEPRMNTDKTWQAGRVTPCA